MTYSMQSVVADRRHRRLDADQRHQPSTSATGSPRGACDPAAAACDNGQVRIISSAEPTVAKSVDHAVGPWGDTFGYTRRRDVAAEPAVLRRVHRRPRQLPAHPRQANLATHVYSGATISCLSGCPGSDPAPSMLPVYRETGAAADELSVAWYLGDLVSQPTERVYRITYQQTFKDADRVPDRVRDRSHDPDQGQHRGRRLERHERAHRRELPARRCVVHRRVVAHASRSRRQPRQRRRTGRRSSVPTLARRQDVPGARRAATTPRRSTSTGGETTGSVPNFRCIAHRDQHHRSRRSARPSSTLCSPTRLPTTSNPGGRPVTTQVISDSDDPLLDAQVTDVPGSPAHARRPRTSVQFTATGIELAPGESVSVTVDLRMTADNCVLVERRAERRAQPSTASPPTSFADTQGNAYPGTSTDTWNLVIAKPQINVSERAFGPARLRRVARRPDRLHGLRRPKRNDPPPDAGSPRLRAADLQRLLEPDPRPGPRRAARRRVRPRLRWLRLRRARRRRPGSTDQVTWAVDAAVVSPETSRPSRSPTRSPTASSTCPARPASPNGARPAPPTRRCADPMVGANPAVCCSGTLNFSGGRCRAATFIDAGASYGQAAVDAADVDVRQRRCRRGRCVLERRAHLPQRRQP